MTKCAMAKAGLIIIAIPAAFAWLVGALFVGGGIYCFLNDIPGDNIVDFWLPGLCILAVALILAVLCKSLAKASKLPKTVEEEVATINREITTLERQMTDADEYITGLAQVNPPDDRLLEFGASNLSELLQRKSERDEFILRFRRTTGLPIDESLVDGSAERCAAVVGSSFQSSLSPEVQALARDPSKKISAISLHRQQTGASLREAKQAVEAFSQTQV